MTGPMLVEGEINSNQVMQKELGILKRGGSEVVRANLIVLPVGNSVLFVKPIFLRSQSAGFSELFRVVVSDGTRIGWGRSVTEGIYDMLGIKQTTEVSDVATSSKACSLDLPRDQLLDYLAKLGQGDPVGAGNTLKDLMEVLGAKPVTTD